MPAARFSVRFFLLATGILFLSFQFNVFGAVLPVPFTYFDARSERLVSAALVVSRQQGIWSNGGMLYNAENDQPYRSQFGLHGLACRVWMKASGQQPATVVRQGRILCALLLAGVLAGFLTAIAGRFGTVPAVTALILMALSDWPVLFARNLYWALSLHFLPFVATWFLYPRVLQGQRRLAVVLAAVAGLVALKCLCGYEYVSTILLSATVPVVFHEVLGGGGPRRLAARVGAVFLSGVLGFAGAVGLHFAQGWSFTGSAAEGWEAIRARALCHTREDPRLPNVPPDIPAHKVLRWYGREHAASLPLWETLTPRGPHQLHLTIRFFWFLLPLAALLALASRRFIPTEQARRRLQALAAAAAWAFLAPLSWALAARAHMCYHPHLNAIIFYLPFLPLMYVLAAVEAEALLRHYRQAASSSGLLRASDPRHFEVDDRLDH